MYGYLQSTYCCSEGISVILKHSSNYANEKIFHLSHDKMIFNPLGSWKLHVCPVCPLFEKHKQTMSMSFYMKMQNTVEKHQYNKMYNIASFFIPLLLHVLSKGKLVLS